MTAERPRPRVVLSFPKSPAGDAGKARRAEVTVGLYSQCAVGRTDRDALAALYVRLNAMLQAVEEAGKVAARLDGAP